MPITLKLSCGFVENIYCDDCRLVLMASWQCKWQYKCVYLMLTIDVAWPYLGLYRNVWLHTMQRTITYSMHITVVTIIACTYVASCVALLVLICIQYASPSVRVDNGTVDEWKYKSGYLMLTIGLTCIGMYHNVAFFPCMVVVVWRTFFVFLK